ncbi:MAG: YfiR family protein [Rhodanobacteraceae bacterium]
MAECVVLLTLLLVRVDAFAQSRQPGVSLEYAVKATYLYKLAPFVNWPPGTFTSPDAPFEICVLGPNPFDDFLHKAIAGRTLGTHPFKVRKLDALVAGSDCQIVFIGYADANEVREALRTFDGKPVLTVTDSNDPDISGSVVQFVINEGRVRFDVDEAAAQHNHLEISSKLLDLAFNVKGGG